MGTPIRHPLIDDITERIALVESRAKVVRLSAPLADLLARPIASGRTLVLLTPESSRVTIGLRSALVAAKAVWAVATPSGFRDGISGVEHATLDEVVRPALHEAAADVDGRGGPSLTSACPLARDVTSQLSVDVTILHRGDDDALLGGALEVIALAVGGYEPRSWGVTEPLEKRWDRWVLTQDARHRAPEPTRAIVEGDHLSAAVTARVTPRGIEETVALTADVPGGAEGLDAAIVRLRAVLADLTRTSLPTFALVLAREGEADHSFRPVTYPAPNPVALLIGAPSVHRLDLDAHAFAPDQPIDVVGRPTRPAFLLPLGDAVQPGWEALHHALDSVGSAKLTTLVDEHPAEGQAADGHVTDAHAAGAHATGTHATDAHKTDERHASLVETERRARHRPRDGGAHDAP